MAQQRLPRTKRWQTIALSGASGLGAAQKSSRAETGDASFWAFHFDPSLSAHNVPRLTFLTVRAKTFCLCDPFSPIAFERWPGPGKNSPLLSKADLCTELKVWKGTRKCGSTT